MINQAKEIVAELLKGVNMKQEKYVKEVLRNGYHIFCDRVHYANTSSGYKAWRKACRIATGKQPARRLSVKQKKEFNDPNQIEMF